MFFIVRFVAAVLAAGLPCSSLLFAQDPGPAARGRAVDRIVHAYMTSHHIPGLSIAVAAGGRIVYARGYGMADLENHVRVTPATVFGTASTLKILTATAILQLAERGRIDLEAPIDRYCPLFAAKRWAPSVSQLLGHQGGVGESTLGDIFRRDHFTTVGDAVRDFAKDSLRFTPGTDVLYSNHGYVLLACAVEGASGQSYDAYLGDHILTPAYMTRTRHNDVFDVIPNRARSYLIRTEENTKDLEGIWQPAHLASIRLGIPAVADPVDPSSDPGAGNYLGTPLDMVRFVIGLQSGLLLADSMARREFVEHRTQSGKSTSRGWGWVVADLHGESVAQVLGSDWNTSFGVLTLPSKHFSVAIASNIQFDQPSELIRQVAMQWGFMRKE